ncbi:MAG: hypothetical protein HY680_01290 [Chloroflexi bacterium]|nr:hypothetical protein [Chloroflexota bacterium]
MNTRASALDAGVAALEAKLDAMATSNSNTSNQFGALVASVVDRKKVDIQVLQVKEKSQYLLYCSEAGQPVTANLTSMLASEAKENSLTFTDVTGSTTVTVVGPGLLSVKVNLPNPVKDAKLFVFNVIRDEGVVTGIGPVEHYGSAMFARDSKLG